MSVNIYKNKKAVSIVGEHAFEEATYLTRQYNLPLSENHKKKGYLIRFDEESFKKFIQDYTSKDSEKNPTDDNEAR